MYGIERPPHGKQRGRLDAAEENGSNDTSALSSQWRGLERLWEGWSTHPKMVFMINRNRAELGLSPRGRAGVSQECRLGGRQYGWFWRGGRGGTGCLGRHSGEKDRCYESKERSKARGWRLGGKTQRDKSCSRIRSAISQRMFGDRDEGVSS